MKDCIMIRNEAGDSLCVPLSSEGSREVGRLVIDGISYHVERMKATTLKREYRVDRDDGYNPQQDKSGRCLIIAPFSKK